MNAFVRLLALVLIAAAAPACTNKNTPVAEGTRNQILHLGNGTEPQDLDPHTVTGVPEHNLIAALFEGLVGEDPVDLHPVPGMAESWTVSADKKTYTFKIRKGAKWTNGDPITAHDFVYSWERILSPALGAEYAYMLFYLENAEAFNKGEIKDFSKVGVKALDDYTLQARLHHATPFFLSLLNHYSSWPVNRKNIEKFGKIDTRGTQWTRPGNMVSNGPFRLKQWELNKIIVVEKNPDYWDAKTVTLNEIRFYPIDSQQTEERNFRAGQLHVTNTIPLNKIAVYKEKEPHLLRVDPYLGTYYYRVNVTKKPLDDVRVRRALAMAIDRQMIVEKVTKGGQIPSHSFVPPNTAGYTSRTKIPFDVEGAKKLLAEAGYPGGKGMAKVEILYNTSEAHKVIAEAVQQMWKQALGIEVELVNQDWKVYLETQKALQYNVARAGWIGDYPDPNTFMDMFVTGGGNNQTGWSNKEYDRLIAEAGRAGTDEARFEAFQKAEKILLEETPIIPIYTYTSVHLISPDVKGWDPNILDHHPYKHVRLEAAGEGVKLSQK